MKRLLTLLAAFTTLLGARAQEELIMTPDAKSMGMGGVVMTTVSGSHTIYGNPAASVFARQKAQLSGSYASLSDMNVYAASGFFNFNGNNLIQAGWRRYGHFGYAGYSNDMTVDVGYSGRINERWGLGVVGHYQRLAGENELSVDLAFLYSKELNLGDYSELRIGGKLANMGASLGRDSDYLPMSIMLGGGLNTFISDAHEITVGMDAGCYLMSGSVASFAASLGVEYNLMQLVQLRAGYHFGPKYSLFSNYASLGAGVRFLHIRLDFAYLFAEKYFPLRNTWSLSFGFDF